MKTIGALAIGALATKMLNSENHEKIFKNFLLRSRKGDEGG